MKVLMRRETASLWVVTKTGKVLDGGYWFVVYNGFVRRIIAERALLYEFIYLGEL